MSIPGNEILQWVRELSAHFLTRPEGVQQCRAYNSAAVAITTGVGTYLAYNSELYDTSGLHSTSVNTGRITFSSAGVWSVSCGHTWAPSATGDRYAALVLNRATFIAEVYAPAGYYSAVNVSTDYRFAAGDYVETYVYHTHGGNLNVGELGLTGVGPRAWMAAHRIA